MRRTAGTFGTPLRGFKTPPVAEGTFWNPYREEFQNGLVVFENLPISTDTTNTFYNEFVLHHYKDLLLFQVLRFL